MLTHEHACGAVLYEHPATVPPATYEMEDELGTVASSGGAEIGIQGCSPGSRLQVGGRIAQDVAVASQNVNIGRHPS